MIDGGRPTPVIIVAGPTASGKSVLAIRIAAAVGGTVINADSMQMYRELRVLTARPTPEDEARVPHRLYGVMSAAERCSAGRWRTLALAEIAAARAAGSVPVLAGGTGLYIKALLEGLSPIPDIPAEIREAARRKLATDGREAVFADLAARDPVTAARTSPSDTQRLLRALEVLLATGEPLSRWQGRKACADMPLIGALTLVLLPPRETLYAACDARFGQMLRQGALEEVARLDAMRLSPDLPAMRAVGVRELLRHLHGEIGLAEAAELARRATRRYAKRQTTWLRHQMPRAHKLNSQFSESVAEEIFPIIHRFLLTG